MRAFRFADLREQSCHTIGSVHDADSWWQSILFAANFGRILVVLAGLATLAFNQCIALRDKKVVFMGSDKESREVNSTSWTGMGLEAESARPSARNKYITLDGIRGYLTLFIPGLIVLHAIEQLIDGKVAFSVLSISRDIISYIPYASPLAVALFIVILIQKSRAVLKKP